MASSKIVVKLDGEQLERITNDVFTRMCLSFECKTCGASIRFDSIGLIKCDYCGQKYNLGIVVDKLK